MSSEANFIADLERAARALRAMTTGALIAGVLPEDIARIVAAGIEDSRQFEHAVRDSRARALALGIRSLGEPTPEPPVDPAIFEGGHGQPGDWDFRPPPIHPMVGRGRQAA